MKLVWKAYSRGRPRHRVNRRKQECREGKGTGGVGAGVQIYVEQWRDDLAKLTRPQMPNFLSK